MAFKIKHKQLLRSTAGSTPDGGSGGATPPTSPRQGPLPSPRRLTSPQDDEHKLPCDDHNCQDGGQTMLYVGNISSDTLEQDLEAAFRKYGRVQGVYLQGRTKKYGFVVFYDSQDADTARCGLNGQDFFGRRVTVEFARKHKIPRYNDRCGHDDQYHHYGQHGGNTELFVSNVSEDIQEYHIEGLFSKYGRVRKVYLKRKICFVEFYDSEDAYHARQELDGEEFGWSRISVEFATERGPGGPAHIFCYNCGTYGQESSDRQASDMKGRCYQCGEKGHLRKNCQNSHKDLGRRRSYSRSQSPHHGSGRGRSWSQIRSCRSYRSDKRAGGEAIQSRSPCYSHRPKSPLPREKAKPVVSPNG